MSEIVVIIRPSFMKFCKDGCQAALFNHILYWIAKKAKGETQEKVQSGEIAYYATTEELIECLAGAWGREKVRMEANNLVNMGLIGRGKNPMHGADRTKHFFFGQEQCQKLLELCQEHKICLACVDLPDEIEHLLKTVKQNPNSGNAKPESMICFTCPKHEHYPNLGLAKPESGQALTKITTKTIKPKITERKNDESQQNLNVSTQESSFSHPSAHASSIISEEVRRTYDLICQELYPNCPPNLTTKAIEHFTKLAKSIKTVEDIKSLVAYCRAEQPILKTSKIQPGNLIRWLDGWIQAQPPITEELPELTGDPVVTDEELAEDVMKAVHAYGESDHFDKHLETVMSFRRMAELSNYKMSEKIFNILRKVSPEKYSIDDFMEKLRQDLYW